MQPTRTIDLNADLGEGCGSDTVMMAVITSASIACGGHAGNDATMARAVTAAVNAGVRVGAHPGYPDRDNFGRASLTFGRASMTMEETDLRRTLNEQVGALVEAAHAYNLAHPDRLNAQHAHVAYVKAHGALYHDAATNLVVATALCDIAWSHHIFTIMGPAGSVLETVTAEHGLTFEAEGFADRAYTPDGKLMDRALPGAVHLVTKDVVAQAVNIAKYGYAEVVGDHLPVRANTLCLHGDTPGAAENATAVRDALLAAGVTLTAGAGR